MLSISSTSCLILMIVTLHLMSLDSKIIARSSKQVVMREVLSRLGSIMALTSPVYPIKKADAATNKGAFELDMEFYIKNLLNISDKSPKQQVFFPSPRYLDQVIMKEFIYLIVSNVSKYTKKNVMQVTEEVDKRLPNIYESLKTFVPLTRFDFSDQYYVDLYILVLYQIAFDNISNLVYRDEMKQQIGIDIYHFLCDRFVKKNIVAESINDTDMQNNKVCQFAFGIKSILDAFVQCKFIESYKYNLNDICEDAIDELVTYPINAEIYLKQPISIIGSVVLQKSRGSLFHPDLFGSVISAYTKEIGEINKISVVYDDYFMDNYYREGNFDVQAQDILLALSISKKS